MDRHLYRIEISTVHANSHIGSCGVPIMAMVEGSTPDGNRFFSFLFDFSFVLFIWLFLAHTFDRTLYRVVWYRSGLGGLLCLSEARS